MNRLLDFSTMAIESRDIWFDDKHFFKIIFDYFDYKKRDIYSLSAQKLGIKKKKNFQKLLDN